MSLRSGTCRFHLHLQVAETWQYERTRIASPAISCQAIYRVELWPCSSWLHPVYFSGAPYLIGRISGTWTALGSAINASTAKSPSKNLVNCKDISEYTPVRKIIKCLCIIHSFIVTWGEKKATWHYRSQSTKAEVMACCLMVPSHHLIQCWLIIKKPSGIHFSILLMVITSQHVMWMYIRVTYEKCLSLFPAGI